MINRRGLLVGKALYFFVFGSQGILVPFLNVYFISIGLSGTQIGWINMLGPLIGIFSVPLWGMLCDRLGRFRLLLGVVVTGAIISVLFVSFTPLFLGIAGLIMAFNFFGSALIPLVDSYNLAVLGEQRANYGQQRIWGTIGFLLTSSTFGIILERIGLRGIFWGYSFMLALFLVAVLALPPQPARMSRTVWSGFTRMIRKPSWLILAASTILVMISYSSMFNFIGVTMETMGARDTLIGQAWSVGAFAEIPVMFFSTWLIRRLKARNMIAIGFFFYGLRLLLYAIMPRPEWVLAINLLHGLSYGFYWLGSVNYVNEMAPDDLKATSQSMLATFFNVASVAGSPISGWMFDSLGPSQMYLISGLVCWSAVSIFIGLNYRHRRSGVVIIGETR